MATQNKEEWLSQAKAAKAANCSQQYISKLIKQGLLEANEKKEVRVADVKTRLKAKKEAKDDNGYWKHKGRHEKAKADLAEIELEEKLADLVPVEQVVKHLAKVFTAIRQRLLGMPAKLTPLIQAEESGVGIRNVLESDINEALQELATYDPGTGKTASGPRRANGRDKNSSPKAKAAPKIKRKRMGR